jgi:sugar/nucleoside kinase (ribokinase family)
MAPLFDILGFGCVAVDDLLYVESYPPADAKAPVLRRERQCGGLVGTALVTAARLGAKCLYVATLGQDDLSAFVLERLRREKIDVSRVARKAQAGPVHSVIVVGQDNGSRNIFPDARGVTAARVPRLKAALVRASRLLFIDHFWIEQKLPAVRIARKAGIPVVADFEDIRDPQFPELLHLVDHLVLSAEIARQITGAEPARAVEKLWSKQRQVVAVTGGADGCWFRAGAAAGHVPAFRVKAVDTTGCGDVFHGAYAAGLTRGMGVEERLRFAAAAAAIKATRPGGQQGIPTRPQLERFLKGPLKTHL